MYYAMARHHQNFIFRLLPYCFRVDSFARFVTVCKSMGYNFTTSSCEQIILHCNHNVYSRCIDVSAISITGESFLNPDASGAAAFKKPIQLPVILVAVHNHPIRFVMAKEFFGNIVTVPQGTIVYAP